MEEMLPQIIITLIIGGVLGYFAGHLVKKVKGMALTVGILALIFVIIAYTGNLELNFEVIEYNISNVIGFITPLGIVALISSVPFVASFIAGVFVGYNRY